MEMFGHTFKLIDKRIGSVNYIRNDYKCSKCNLEVWNFTESDSWYFCYKNSPAGTLFNDSTCPTCDEVIIKNIIE